MDECEFLWMTAQETSVWPQCSDHGAALSVDAPSGKTIMALNWEFNCVCGVGKALTTKPVVFECIHPSLCTYFSLNPLLLTDSNMLKSYHIQ